MKVNFQSINFTPITLQIQFQSWQELDKFCESLAHNFDFPPIAYQMLISMRDLSKPKPF
jgi:hypothetical protein